MATEGNNLIFSYTRKEALEDGTLIDVSTQAKESGFKYPIAITSAVSAQLSKGAGKDKEIYTARLNDVLLMLRIGITRIKGDTVYFKVKVGRGLLALWAKCGPGDTADPVITIMCTTED